MNPVFRIMGVISHVNIGATLALAAWLIFSPTTTARIAPGALSSQPTANHAIAMEAQP